MIADALLINDFQIECEKIKTEWPATKIARRGCCALFSKQNLAAKPAAAAYQNATLWPYHRIECAPRRLHMIRGRQRRGQIILKKRGVALSSLSIC